MSKDLSSDIAENAVAPKRVTGDSGSMEMHPIADQIAAHRFLAETDNADKPGLGLRFRKLKPPGA